MNNQWSLFGFDLARAWDYVRLGFRQLLMGLEAGIRQRFYSEIAVISWSDVCTDEFSVFGLSLQPVRAGENLAVLIPDDLVLLKTLELPVESELELDAVISFEATASSPFSGDDTVFGWRIVSRSEGMLIVALAISSRAAIHKLMLARDETRGRQLSDIEIWTCCEGALIQFEGFGEELRNADYLQRLSHGGALSFLLVLGLCFALAIPAIALQMRAGRLQELAFDTELTAGVATESRNRLTLLEAKLTDARSYFDERLYYQELLDRLANATPDSVYLRNLSLDDGRLTLSGFADNAAEYQTMLASANIVSELSAPAAFTRDSKADKERFTLTMRIDGSAK